MGQRHATRAQPATSRTQFLKDAVFLLDTDVLLTLMRASPNSAVLAWGDGQPGQHLCISAVTRAEIELGIALLPAGKPKTRLAKQAGAVFDEDFAGRCLPFDETSASPYAVLVAQRSRKGRPISVEDAQIAALALRNSKTLVTRDTADFERTEGLILFNPWSD